MKLPRCGRRPQTRSALLAALEDPTWAVRKSAVEALGRMRNPESVEAIASLLGDSDQDVRETAVVALGEMGEARVIPQLVAALADPLSSVRQLAAAALHKLDRRWERSELARQAIPALQSAAGDTEYWVRHSALEVLKRLQRDRSAEAEPPVLNENVRAFRSAAGQVFCHALRSANRDLRIAAAESLGRLGDVLHAVPLVAALEDADPWVRRAAAGSLRALSWQPANEQQQDLFAKAMG
jgi:HEAT repeat protein